MQAPDLGRGNPPSDLPESLTRDMDRDMLSRLVRDVNDTGASFAQMAERADAAGFPLSKPYFQKMATNAVTTAPTPDRLRGLAAGLKRPLAVVQRAAAVQYLDYQATELAGYDEEVRIVVAHLAGMDPSERRRWRRMIEASEQNDTEQDG